MRRSQCTSCLKTAGQIAIRRWPLLPLAHGVFVTFLDSNKEMAISAISAWGFVTFLDSL